MISKYKPGPGWKHMGGVVWEHCSGVRIHVAGLCGMVPGTMIDGKKWPESKSLDRYIRINGGNRRRGVMAWALKRFPTL